MKFNLKKFVLPLVKGNFQDPSIIPDTFPSSGKAIILTSIMQDKPTLFNTINLKQPTKFIITKVDENYSTKNKRKRYFFPLPLVRWFEKYDYAMIEPGNYVVEKIECKSGGLNLETEFDGIFNKYDKNNEFSMTSFISNLAGVNDAEKNQPRIFLSFKVEPGEIVYLGDVRVNMQTPDASLEQLPIIEDNFAKVSNDFLSVYKQFQGQLIKQEFMKINNCSFDEFMKGGS